VNNNHSWFFVWSFVVMFVSCRVLCCCGVVLVVRVVLFLLCVCVCDLFLSYSSLHQRSQVTHLHYRETHGQTSGFESAALQSASRVSYELRAFTLSVQV